MTVRLYGRMQGHSSHAQVTDGFIGVLRQEQLLAGYVPLDLSAISEDVLREKDPDAFLGGAAEHGVFTGALGHVESMIQHAAHRWRWVMVAPNSDRIPEGLVREIRRVATNILAPSSWAAEQLSKIFELPVMVVPHGVDESFKPDEFAATQSATSYDHGYFTVVHFSTSDRERKGTLELLRAWNEVTRSGALSPHSQLVLVLDPHARARLLDRIADDETCGKIPRVTFMDRIDATPRQMAYMLGRAHLICQPSRAEAFGLVPLEALCCGVPIAATVCTGHSQYLDAHTPGLELITHGELAPIDDVPGAVAPAVASEAIREALLSAHQSWKMLHAGALAGAAQMRERWAWSRALAPFVTKLKAST